MLTPKQSKLVNLLIENYGHKGKTKTLGALMIEAGYSESSAVNPQLIINDEMREILNPVIEKMEKIRTKALDSITDDKLENASARDNAAIADTLTKNIQLLSGKETERTGVTVELVNYESNNPPPLPAS
jgi:phage terminase small subunit